jgi:hypothetical protein
MERRRLAKTARKQTIKQTHKQAHKPLPIRPKGANEANPDDEPKHAMDENGTMPHQ